MTPPNSLHVTTDVLPVLLYAVCTYSFFMNNKANLHFNS